MVNGRFMHRRSQMACTTAFAIMRGAVLTLACEQRRGWSPPRDTSGDGAASDGILVLSTHIRVTMTLHVSYEKNKYE